MTATLFALACHFAGDFPLQSNHMAAEKFDDRGVRAKHCAVYTLAFLPFVLSMGWGPTRAAVFATLLFWSHFAIDSRRWNDNVPIWYDQALHVIALAACVAITGGVPA